MDINKLENEPFVSIIVATYHRDDELVRALNSIATLNYCNYEIILVDDNDDIYWNSKVEQIVSAFKSNNSEIIIKHITNSVNLGPAKARNAGINVAKGDYICFLDDDDIYLPDRIINQIIPMMKASADYSITDLELYYEDANLAEIRKREYIKETSVEELFRYHLMYHMTGTDTLMYKKEYLDKIGRFDPIDLGDEFYLMSKSILGGGVFKYVEGCDVKAFVHELGGGMSTGALKIEGENSLYEYKKTFFDRLDKKTIRYIKMRHHAVLTYSYYKMNKFVSVGKEFFLALLSSPSAFFRLLKNRLNRI